MDSLTQNQRGKSGTRESGHLKMGRSGSGSVCEQYRVSLEQRIAQGGIDPVCGDEDLCQRVERMLKEGGPKDILDARGLDTMATMEDSLQALPVWGHSAGGLTEPATAAGLGAISKAFEVLERAALNLYLCPWRKEYRVVKIFSGMFTHLVRPALSEQQAAQLFGLLGYRLKGAELELRGPPPSQTTLLSLAFAFFAARCEGRLLAMAAAASGGRPGAELTLVRERRKGRSLQEALESLRQETESSGWDDKDDIDLYTADGEGGSGETEEASAGKVKLSTAPVSRVSVSLPPAGGSSGSVSAPRQRFHMTLYQSRHLGPDEKQAVSQTANDGGMVTPRGQNPTCTCSSNPAFLYVNYCEDCNERHSLKCPVGDSCRKNKHNVECIDHDSSKKTKHNQERADLDSNKKAQYNLQLFGDTALPGRAVPNVGGDLAAAYAKPTEVGAAAGRREKTSEERASGTQMVGQGGTCDTPGCTNLSCTFCTCGFKICEQCWTSSKIICQCGKKFPTHLPTSTPV